MKQALVIEDDPQIAELLSIHLDTLHYKSTLKFNGLDGLTEAVKGTYDLILLDLMLPSIDGLEICKKIRAHDISTPIIMVTAKSEEIDKVLGLETGADDYITKPFSIRELQARIKAVARRMGPVVEMNGSKETSLDFGRLKIDVDKRVAHKDNERLDLTPKEFDLLSILAQNPGKSFNRQSLLNLVWGYDFEGFEHTVNSHINRLRAKIEDDMAKPKYILTTWGYGYRFGEELSAS